MLSILAVTLYNRFLVSFFSCCLQIQDLAPELQGASHIVLENPDLISRAVLRRGLDAQTAFQIVSIDIADIDVGHNIGARLQADQAEADTRVARARAEGRRPAIGTVDFQSPEWAVRCGIDRIEGDRAAVEV